MRIGIDMSLIPGERAGGGQYAYQLGAALTRIDKRHRYRLYPVFYYIVHPDYPRAEFPTSARMRMAFRHLPPPMVLWLWRAEGWARHVGRAPRPEDYLLASEDGRVEPGWNLNRWFKEDAERLGLRSGRSVYACRATFISLSQEGGAAERDVKRITHPSPVEAFDSYQRKRALWPRYCSAVMAIRLPPVAIPSSGGIATLSHAAGARSKNACRSEELQAFQGVGAAGFEPATPAV